MELPFRTPELLHGKSSLRVTVTSKPAGTKLQSHTTPTEAGVGRNEYTDK